MGSPTRIPFESELKTRLYYWIIGDRSTSPLWIPAQGYGRNVTPAIARSIFFSARPNEKIVKIVKRRLFESCEKES